MYIPTTFIGSALCSGSGYGYTYYNSVATTDNFSYTSQCGISNNVDLLQSQSIQFSAISTTGINANTLLVDLIWNVTGSERGGNPLCYLRSYTLSYTFTGVDTFEISAYYIDNTGFKNRTFGNGINNVTVYSATIPKIYEINRVVAVGTLTGITITDNGEIGDSQFTSNFRNAPVKKTLVQLTSASVGEVARVDYLDLDNNYKRYSWSQNTRSGSTGTVSAFSNYILSKTTPFVVSSGSLVRSADIGLINFMSGSIFQPASSSCYSYYVQVPYTTRVSYTDCNNITQSIVVNYPATSSITLCAKANSVSFPVTGSWLQSAIIEPKNPC